MESSCHRSTNTSSRKCLRAVGILALFFATAAHAAPKYTREESKIQAAQTAISKVTQHTKDERKRPELSTQDVFSGVGEELKQVTDSQIAVLMRLIENTTDDAVDDKGELEKPEYLFRLADLYADNQHYFNFRARELDQKIFDAEQAGDAKLTEELKAKQASYEKAEKDWLLKSVKQYKDIIDNAKFSRYRRMDQVLFYLAYLLSQQKREDLARQFFKRLIKDYPGSPFIPDAYFAFGEYYFDNADLENALKFYTAIIEKFPEARVAAYAKYKEAWCFYNLQDFKKALATFIEVIQGAQTAVKKDPNRAALLKESRKDAVRTYAQIAPADKAWPFFQRIGGESAPTLMELLGELYNGQGRFDESIKVYRQLMMLYPMDAKLCGWQTEILRNTLSRTGSRATPDAVKELQNLSALYEKYRVLPGLKAEKVDECRGNTAGMLRELATTWHAEAQKTSVKETYDLAHYLYKEYLNRFPKERDIYLMTYYYGELLWKLERFCEAAPVYNDVVNLDNSDKAKYRNDAAYAAVLAWKNCYNVEDAPPPPAKTAGAKPQELPEKWKKMLVAFDNYIKYVPQAKELPSIKYNRARIYYDYNHFDEAVPLFRDIVDHHRDSDLAIYSVNLLFDCENVLDKVDDLDNDTKKYCPMPELNKDDTFRQQCTVIQNGIARKRIEQWEKQGLHRKAADEYVRLGRQNPNDPKIAELWYNAAVNYEKAKLIGQAIQARNKLIELKPDDPLAKKSVYLLGRAFQDIAAFPQAADYYEQFASKWPGEQAPTDAALALFTAAFFRRGLGETEKSIEDTTTFVRNYGGRKESEEKAAGTFFDLGQIYEEKQDWDRLEKHLLEYLRVWGAKGGVDREIIARVKLGELKWRMACTAPGGGVNGACIQVTRIRASSATGVAEKARKGKRKGPTQAAQCGPETKSKITVFQRKPALAKEAQDYFAAALKLWQNGAALKKVPGKDEIERNRRIDSLTYFVAEARMMQGDEVYEKLLTITIPAKLNFTPPDPNTSKARQQRDKQRLEDSQKKFAMWFESKGKTLQSAQMIYQNVILFKQAHWAIAAAARIGQLFQDFSGQLYTAPIPKAGSPPAGVSMSQEEFDQIFRDAYCDKMVDTAEPLEVKAIEGLKTCLDKSTELSWYNEWSSLCEAELNQIKPAEYPIAAEIRATPGYIDRRADPAPVISTVEVK